MAQNREATHQGQNYEGVLKIMEYSKFYIVTGEKNGLYICKQQRLSAGWSELLLFAYTTYELESTGTK